MISLGEIYPLWWRRILLIVSIPLAIIWLLGSLILNSLYNLWLDLQTLNNELPGLVQAWKNGWFDQ